MGRLILDTDLLIAHIRGEVDLAKVTATDDVALPAVAIAEFLTGVLRTKDDRRRAAQRTFLDGLVVLAPVVDYTAEVAEHHAALLAHTRQDGGPRGYHDLIIAAMARATDRTILTRDTRARFDELPGVSACVVTA